MNDRAGRRASRPQVHPEREGERQGRGARGGGGAEVQGAGATGKFLELTLLER